LKALLTGGDRRSIARSNRAREHLNKDATQIEELAALTADDDWLVSMRAVDLLEKLAHEQPERVQPHKRLFIGPLAESDKWEIRLQIVRALPLLRWTPRERPRVIEILRRNVDYPQTFVRAWALDSLATFAVHDPKLRQFVKRRVTEFERSDSKALQARARHIRSRLGVKPYRSVPR
jgi:HEAT repeat protein